MAKKLKDDMLIRLYEMNASNVLDTCGALRAQEISNNEEIVDLKATVKDDISRDGWYVGDIGKLGDLMRLKVSILQKKVSYRTKLQTLKDGIPDADYKKDIQDEIDLL